MVSATAVTLGGAGSAPGTTGAHSGGFEVRSGVARIYRLPVYVRLPLSKIRVLGVQWRSM